ncbi:unnamed protein product [Soboliphyme baturini]|uniref:Tnp_zf-ribbon_2 domain-containing protein n=1 Tax=Soboliphyme baturini TaxID=241478 RepID=A0A183J3Q1_9BILA|nr:unnamed protein product [Soboliphyme baturini]
MGFLRRVAGLLRFDMVPSADVRKILGVQPLLLQMKKFLLGCLRHALRMILERKAKKPLLSQPTYRGLQGRPGMTCHECKERLCPRLRLSVAEGQTWARIGNVEDIV